jgi:hypothetical protein
VLKASVDGLHREEAYVEGAEHGQVAFFWLTPAIIEQVDLGNDDAHVLATVNV